MVSSAASRACYIAPAPGSVPAEAGGNSVGVAAASAAILVLQNVRATR